MPWSSCQPRPCNWFEGFLAALLSAASKKGPSGLVLAIPGRAEGTDLNIESRFWGDTHHSEDGGLDVGNADRFFLIPNVAVPGRIHPKEPSFHAAATGLEPRVESFRIRSGYWRSSIAVPQPI